MSVTTQIRDLSKLKKNAETACRLLFQECYKAGIKNIFITETLRTKERQKYLFAQGRTRPGKVVTWTLNSNHFNGLAWDMACSDPSDLYDRIVLTKVGKIAGKLGITWGGTWKDSYDAPHFEVKSNWSMPKGYKLEGTVIVPSNNKLKVQLHVEDKKEVVSVTNVFNPGSPSIATEVENFIKKAVKDGIIDVQHLVAVQNKTMTTDRLVGLQILINERREREVK